MSNDTISEALDLIPMPDKREEPQQVEPYVDDYEFAKKNMKEIIEVGKQALNDLADLATQTQHPRAYEVLSNHIKILLDAQKGLVDLKNPNQEINNTQINQTKINNSIVVGSTADLQHIIAEMTKNKK